MIELLIVASVDSGLTEFLEYIWAKIAEVLSNLASFINCTVPGGAVTISLLALTVAALVYTRR